MLAIYKVRLLSMMEKANVWSQIDKIEGYIDFSLNNFIFKDSKKVLRSLS